MDRRAFLASAAALPTLAQLEAPRTIPTYRVATTYGSAGPGAGMPGAYPGRVVTVHSAKCIDEATEAVDVPTVREMIARGMTTLTGDRDPRDSWARSSTRRTSWGSRSTDPARPARCRCPMVAEIVRNLAVVGVPPTNITIHERGGGQILLAKSDQFVPAGVRIASVDTWLGYDPDVYVEANFFGEEDTRSHLLRMVTSQFTKIINVPNMKDHSASGVTGCLKNIAYGEFGNVARSHYRFQTETYSFIGTLAAVEPLRSRTVLNIMDGLRGVWHAGPFSTNKRYRFYPKQMKFGTDPVAIDWFLIDVIEKRKQEGAISVWNKEPRYFGTTPQWQANPSVNRFVRETGHIEYASRLGLGVYDVGISEAGLDHQRSWSETAGRRWLLAALLQWSRRHRPTSPFRGPSASGLVSQGARRDAGRRVRVPGRSTAGASERSQRRAGHRRTVGGFQWMALPTRADARQLREAPGRRLAARRGRGVHVRRGRHRESGRRRSRGARPLARVPQDAQPARDAAVAASWTTARPRWARC